RLVKGRVLPTLAAPGTGDEDDAWADDDPDDDTEFDWFPPVLLDEDEDDVDEV
ncbi:hypothetical protein FRB99_006848, partial [Tulasnella sp. 403]